LGILHTHPLTTTLQHAGFGLPSLLGTRQKLNVGDCSGPAELSGRHDRPPGPSTLCAANLANARVRADAVLRVPSRRRSRSGPSHRRPNCGRRTRTHASLTAEECCPEPRPHGARASRVQPARAASTARAGSLGRAFEARGAMPVRGCEVPVTNRRLMRFLIYPLTPGARASTLCARRSSRSGAGPTPPCLGCVRVHGQVAPSQPGTGRRPTGPKPRATRQLSVGSVERMHKPFVALSRLTSACTSPSDHRAAAADSTLATATTACERWTPGGREARYWSASGPFDPLAAFHPVLRFMSHTRDTSPTRLRSSPPPSRRPQRRPTPSTLLAPASSHRSLPTPAGARARAASTPTRETSSCSSRRHRPVRRVGVPEPSRLSRSPSRPTTRSFYRCAGTATCRSASSTRPPPTSPRSRARQHRMASVPPRVLASCAASSPARPTRSAPRPAPRAGPGELAGATDWRWMSLARAGRRARADSMLRTGRTRCRPRRLRAPSPPLPWKRSAPTRC
jgi:hypothetical protein